MKKQPQITEQTKDKLRAAFWTLYTSKPIDKITIKEITDLAGYNRGTFYLYYKDVYDIFASIEMELLQASEQILETARESELSGLKNHMSMIMALARKYSAYVSVLLRDPSSNQFSRKLREMIWPVLRPYLIQHPCTKQEESILEEFYLCGLLAAISSWVKEEEPLPIDQFISFVLSNVLPFSKEA